MDNGRPLRDEHEGRGFDHRHKTIFLKVAEAILKV